MDKNLVQDWLKLAPSEMRDAITGLNSDENWAVFLYLLDHTGKKTKLAELMKAFNASKTEIKNSLKDLGNSGLTAKHASNIKQFQDEEYYIEATFLGERVFEGLFNAVIPETIRKE